MCYYSVKAVHGNTMYFRFISYNLSTIQNINNFFPICLCNAVVLVIEDWDKLCEPFYYTSTSH